MEKLYPIKAAGNVPTAGDVLGNVSENTVRSWVSAGKLRRTKVGRRTMISESELQRFIDAGGSEPSPGGRWRRPAVAVPKETKCATAVAAERLPNVA